MLHIMFEYDTYKKYFNLHLLSATFLFQVILLPTLAIAKPLHGYKIAIDPGHLGGQWAVMERRLMRFENAKFKLKEGDLNFYVATQLEKRLKDLGANTLLTRKKGESSLLPFEEWLIAPQELEKGVEDIKIKYPETQSDTGLQNELFLLHKAVKNRTKVNHFEFLHLFRKVYLKLDLYNRSKIINEFQPNITFIIHFNSDNWLDGNNKPVKKNFNAAFVLNENKGVFNTSLKLCETLVRNLASSTNVGAKSTSLFNIFSNSKLTYASTPSFKQFFKKSSTGVFNNSLVLTRTLNNTYCYGESLFQDNESEALNLAAADKWRLNQVVQAYVDTAVEFLIAN